MLYTAVQFSNRTTVLRKLILRDMQGMLLLTEAVQVVAAYAAGNLLQKSPGLSHTAVQFFECFLSFSNFASKEIHENDSVLCCYELR